MIVFLRRIIVIVGRVVAGPGLTLRYRGAHDTLLIVTRGLNQLVRVRMVLRVLTTFTLLLLLLWLLVYWPGGLRLRQNC